LLDQHDQDGKHEQLVRQRVEELAEIAHRLGPARELAVHRVGERERDEDDGGDQVVVRKIREQQQHEKRDRDEPAHGQRVGQVDHALSLTCYSRPSRSSSSSTSGRFISTSRDFDPWYPPITRCSASWSTMRPAREYPTLNLRCTSDTDAPPSAAHAR